MELAELRINFKELCTKLGGRLRKDTWYELGKELEMDVCRIPTYNKNEIYTIFEELKGFAENEIGIPDVSHIGGAFRVGRSNNSSISAEVKIENGENIKAIELAFNPNKKELHITPITKRGRGCSIFFGKFNAGSYCYKDGTYAESEGFAFPF